MIKTTSAIVVYDPLDIVFDVIAEGGSAIQKKETSTGRYDPDREITPLVLSPNLQVRDPEKMISDGDYTSSIINSRWYINEAVEANRIISGEDGFEIGDYGALMISKNLLPEESDMLVYTGEFIDSRRSEVISFRKIIALGCEYVTEISLALEFDAPPRLALVPFKNLTTRTIKAQLFNGTSEVADADAVYEWKVLDGVSFRRITTEDVFYVSGIDTKELTIHRHYIDKEVIRVEAYHTSQPTTVESNQTKIHRWYGQWEPACDIVRGKAIHANTTESEVQVKVTNRQGDISNPEQYFDIGIYYRRDITGESWRNITHTPHAVVPASYAGIKYGVRTVFGAEVRELSALRAVQIDGANILINGMVACMQIPSKTSEV